MKRASNDDKHDDPNKFFEYWFHLATHDPERFALERVLEIEKVILSAPIEHQHGLRQLQWTIDGERRKAKNPIDGMLRLHNMMQNHLYGDCGLVSTLPLWAQVSQNLVDIGTELGGIKEAAITAAQHLEEI